MSFLEKFLGQQFQRIRDIFLPEKQKVELHRVKNFRSKELKREIWIDVFLPPEYFNQPQKEYPVLFLNDGQDLKEMKMGEILGRLIRSKKIREIIVVGLHAGDRMQEYGTIEKPDYKKRGKKAEAYAGFINNELFPFLTKRYRLTSKAEERAFAGFSLGGLSAFDIVWNYPDVFGLAGVFSGSLWWRYKAFDKNDPDAHRVIHDMVEECSEKKEGLRFWFQAGTEDEKEDRNNNGIIDAIDDTLQLISLLQQLGYHKEGEVTYVEVKGGKHNPATWARAMPDFLTWAFGKTKDN